MKLTDTLAEKEKHFITMTTMKPILALALLLAPLLAAAAERPNILFIFSDDHAQHAISAYGSKVNTTPHLDRLAREGSEVFIGGGSALLRVHHREGGLGESLAHEREGLRAAEVVVAGVGCAAFPRRGFSG